MSEKWKVATPIDAFVNTETGSQIDVVSMVHVGMPSYYRKLGGYIMGRQDEGFKVHYEGITESDGASRAASPLGRIKERVHEAHLDQLAEGYALVAVYTGYTFQDSSTLFHEEGSENHDITDADYSRHTGLFRHISEYGNSRRLTHKFEKSAHKGPEHLDEFVFGVIKHNVDKSMGGKARSRRRDKVTIHMRNQVVLEGVDGELEADKAAKLVLVWGLDHFAGLRSGLIERGYEHAGHQETDLAVNHNQLERNIQKLEVALRCQQAKVDRHQRITGRSTTLDPRRSQTLTQFEVDQLRRQKETQKWLAAREQRSKDIMQKFDEDRKRRESRPFSTAASNDKRQDRRFLPWFSNK